MDVAVVAKSEMLVALSAWTLEAGDLKTSRF
jgi:hypothetical protein